MNGCMLEAYCPQVNIPLSYGLPLPPLSGEPFTGRDIIEESYQYLYDSLSFSEGIITFWRGCDMTTYDAVMCIFAAYKTM